MVKESLMKNFTVRQDLMSTDFPSIWLEVNETNKQTVLLSGFYCEWNHKGNKSEASQVKCFEEFSNQIEKAVELGKSCIILPSEQANSP